MSDDNDTDNIAQLRAALDAANDRAAKADRALALSAAGVDLTTPIGQMFAKAYDGEPTADKITEAWKLVAPSAPADPADTEPPPPAAPEITADDQASTDVRRDLASNGGTHAPPPDKDPRDRMRDRVESEMKAGRGRNNALAAGFEELVSAAAAGDKRAIVDVWGSGD